MEERLAGKAGQPELDQDKKTLAEDRQSLAEYRQDLAEHRTRGEEALETLRSEVRANPKPNQTKPCQTKPNQAKLIHIRPNRIES